MMTYSTNLEDLPWRIPEDLFQDPNKCKNLEIAITPFVWLLSNGT
jgi:hypothetical protein